MMHMFRYIFVKRGVAGDGDAMYYKGNGLFRYVMRGLFVYG
jgi:hypothetical protein